MNSVNTGRQDPNLDWFERDKKQTNIESDQPIAHTRRLIHENTIATSVSLTKLNATTTDSISAKKPPSKQDNVPRESVPPVQISKQPKMRSYSDQSASSVRQRKKLDGAPSADTVSKVGTVKKPESNDNIHSKRQSFKNMATKTADSVRRRASEPLTGSAPITLGSALILLVLASAAIGAVVIVEKSIVGAIRAIYNAVIMVNSFFKNLIWGTQVAEDVVIGSARTAEKIAMAPVHVAENIARAASGAAENVAKESAQSLGDAVRGAVNSAENVAMGTARAAVGAAAAMGAKAVGNAVKGATHVAENVVIGTAHAAEKAAAGTAHVVDEVVDATLKK